MNRIYKALLWISQKLTTLGFNTIVRKIHDKTTIPLINKKTIEYMNAGHNENQAIIEALYDLDFISDKEIQVLRKYLNYQVGGQCKMGKPHLFDNDGKCYYCGIIECATGLKNHLFDNYGKCYYCGIIGCVTGLNNHLFDNYGKCYYCGIKGCVYGLKNHLFDINGKCYYCGIIGCVYGLKNHLFDYDNKCYSCGIHKK